MGTTFQLTSGRMNRSKKYTILSGFNETFLKFQFMIQMCGFAVIVQPLLNVLGIIHVSNA